MHPGKIRNILRHAARDRYDYFVRKVADREELWGLAYADGSWVVSKNDSVTVFPFWPEEEFADIAAKGDWALASPASVSLNDFADNWVPGLEQNREQVGIFWHPDSLEGVDISARDLLND